MIRFRYGMAALACACGGAAVSPSYAQHMGDVWIGRSSDATGRQLKVATAIGGFDPYDPGTNLVVLEPTEPGGFFEGWSSDSPGFDAIRTEAPAADTFKLGEGVLVWLDVVSIDPGLVVAVPPNYDILTAPGQSARLGDRHLHKHLIWLIDSTDPSFDPRRCVWRATFRLRDSGSTQYAASAPFTIRFANAPVAIADFDCDGDVDLADFTRFQECFNGPNRPSATSDCGGPDLDLDDDVDLGDFSLFQTCFNGPNRTPACP